MFAYLPLKSQDPYTFTTLANIYRFDWLETQIAFVFLLVRNSFLWSRPQAKSKSFAKLASFNLPKFRNSRFFLFPISNFFNIILLVLLHKLCDHSAKKSWKVLFYHIQKIRKHHHRQTIPTTILSKPLFVEHHNILTIPRHTASPTAIRRLI